MRIRLRDFNGGLVVTPPADKIPDNALYYAKGIHRLTRGSAKIRQGSTALHTVADVALGSAGIFYWNDTWFYGTSDSLYQGSTCISSGTYDGNRLTFAVGGPTAGVSDRLFIAGGSTVTLRKVDTSNTVTNWGITPPPDTHVATTAGTTGGMSTGKGYLYRLAYYNDQTGTRSNPTTTPSTAGFSTTTKLLIHGGGVHAATGFTDVSPSAHTVVSTGTAAVSTATADPFGLDTGVIALDGTTDSWLAVADHSDWNFSTGPFTVDFWVNFIDASTVNASKRYFLTQSSGGAAPYIYFYMTVASATHRVGISSPLVNVEGDYGSLFSTATWYHIAYVRGWGGDNDNVAICVDGALVTASTVTGSLPDVADLLVIGSNINYSTGVLNGYMSEVRVVKDEAKWIEPFTPSTVAYGSAYIATGADDKAANIAGITPSTDSQVTHTEIWRTQGDGTSFFLATRVAATATSYEDQIADADLGVTELPTNNLKPYSWFDDCVVHNASMFWLTRSQTGEKGRVYYSPIGRLEAVDGFINVTDDGEPLKKFVKYGTGLGVLSEAGFYEILGENPYYSRRVPGVPGTIEPHSVAITPYGVAYEAADGPRLLTGSQAVPLGDGAVDAVFQGETRGQLSAFTTDTVADYARDEYIICNAASSNSLACNLRTRKWRDLGIIVDAIHYSPETDQVAVAHVASSAVYEFEKEGETDDSGTGIPFAIETKHINATSQEKVLVRNVFIDADTTNTTMSVELIYDSTAKTLSNLICSCRSVAELPVNTFAREFGIRISSTISVNVEIFGIDFDVYIPEEERDG